MNRERPRPPKPAFARPASTAPQHDATPGLAIRQAASKLLAAVVEARTSLDGLTDEAGGHPAYRALQTRDRALLRAILGAALRHRTTLARLIGERLDRPLPANATALNHILHVGAAQILYLDVPDHAAVDLAVTQAKLDPRTRRFDKLVNAILRGLSRNKSQEAETSPDAPAWLRERLLAAYGEARTGQILAMHAIEPPIDFTVKRDPALWADRLGGIVLPTGSVRLPRLEQSVTELPGFGEGEWWVQDAAAALPARLLGDIKGQRVADLCAAPGGKTAQLVLAGGRVTALDINRNRLNRLRSNLARLQLEAETVEADLTRYEPDEAFDAVLLDAPCSSTGTIRRHPDVAWTKSAEEVAKLADVQARLLGHAVRLTRTGGHVVFSNCSLDPVEGEELVARFLSENSGVALDPVQPDEFDGLAPFVTREGYVRTTPADLMMETPALSGMDGFFAARLRKV